MFISQNDTLVKTTTHKAVLPFYVYASLSLLAATIMLFFSSGAFTLHHFHPHTLAITHAMALGWGTMIILGASHQLVPVLIEGSLYSYKLAYACFVFAAMGIPLLVFGFYTFQLGFATLLGAVLINVAIVAFLVNMVLSMLRSKHESVHAVFVLTAVLWLLLTTLVGLALTINFTTAFLPKASLHYLSLHAHMGIVGWLLLLVIGVGSRLIPMFLISKYNNPRLLWAIYGLANAGLVSFLCLFLYAPESRLVLLPVLFVLCAIMLFGFYCYQCYQKRIRKQVDAPVKISLLSVVLMLFPAGMLLTLVMLLLFGKPGSTLILAYGFTIFFGWLTALIFGMTFKTLPFIIWNKVYHLQAGAGKTPNPKDLFSSWLFLLMSLFYLLGFAMFITAIFAANILLLQIAALLLIVAALLYNWNVFKLVLHKTARPWK